MVRVPLGVLVVNHDKRTKRWHTVTLRIVSVRQMKDIIEWIESNVEAYEKHTYHDVAETGGYMEFRFRYSKDYEWFVLRWQ
jgi:hypothetical protein